MTAAAALDSGVITPETAINAPGSLIDEGQPLENDFSPQNWGCITLDTALTNSVNTWFAQVGAKVGEDTLFEYMERFGFNSQAADRPALRRAAWRAASSTSKTNGRLLTRNDPIDIERVAIGQERLLATPLQIAEVAAAVANKRQADEAADLGQGHRSRRPGGRKRLTRANTASRSAKRPRQS